jgi:hypothetical protein
MNILASKFYKSFLHIFFLFFFSCLFSCMRVHAQTPVLRVTNIYNEQRIVYNNDSMMHTAWKPVLYVDTATATATGSWFQRKFFHEHLLQLREKNFNLDADIIVDEYIGHSERYIPTGARPGISSDSVTHTPMMNTRGYEITGNLSEKFYFETAFYENQGRFGGYTDSFIRKYRVIPGQGGYKNVGDGKGFDFSASNARLVYMPSKHFAFDLGYGKNFIGDGHRSLLLSDWSFNYPYLKTSVTYGKFQYNVMWSQYIVDRNPAYNNKQGYYRKWGQTFLVDWQPTHRLSLSVFETVMWPDQDSMRNKDISASLFSPIIFVHGNQSPSGVHNNVIAGANIKYRVFDHTHLYGQFALDGTGSGWQNRYALQLGIRSGNTFGVNNFNTQVEANIARPYTYATNTPFTNYQHNNQALAHPLGANFKEGLVIAEYTYKSWRLRAESFIAKYGADSAANANYGHDIFKMVDTRSVSDDVSIGQGLSTKIFYADLRLAYILNPATNMRIETGFTFRNEKNDVVFFKDRIFYIGIRMSFRRIDYDF